MKELITNPFKTVYDVMSRIVMIAVLSIGSWFVIVTLVKYMMTLLVP